MTSHVSKEAIERTTQCPHNLECLNAGKGRCQVLFGGNKEMILKASCSSECPYSKPFDFGDFCTCPVHCELDTKYRLQGEEPETQ